MKKILLAGAVLALSIGTASAADFAVKAPPPIPFSVNASGWYVGVGTEAGVAQSSVSGTTFPTLTSGNLNADGASIAVDAGYIWSNCLLQTWCQLEADVKYQNIGGTTMNGAASIDSRWALSQEFDIGLDAVQGILAVLNVNASTAFPTFNPSGLLPANIAVAATPRGYLGFISQEMLISGNLGAASGQQWAWAPGVTAGWRWQTLNSQGKPNSGSLKVYADILWAQRGVTFDNVFAANGAPITVNSSAKMNQLYLVGVRYDFGFPSYR